MTEQEKENIARFLRKFWRLILFIIVAFGIFVYTQFFSTGDKVVKDTGKGKEIVAQKQSNANNIVHAEQKVIPDGAPLTEEDFNLLGLKIGMTQEQIKAIIGTLNFVEEHPNKYSDKYSIKEFISQDGGIKVFFNNANKGYIYGLEQFSIMNKNYCTARQLYVGDSEEKMFLKYGKKYFKKRDLTNDSYILIYKVDELTYIDFKIENKVIKEINYVVV